MSARETPGALFCPNDGLPLLRSDCAPRCVDDPLAGTLLDGRYAVFEPTSSHDLPGQAYHALQLPESSHVLVHAAVPDEFGGEVDPQRFLLAAPQYLRLRAPGLLPVLDHGALPEGGVYLVSAPFAGPTLRDVLRASTRAAGWPAALGLASELLGGLQALHARRRCHASLTPGRLVVRGTQRCRLVAIGLGFDELLRPSQSEQRTRQPSKFQLDAHTAAYLSPEQIEELHPDPRSDVYSLGCLLFHLIVGSAPYRGRGALQILSAHLAGRFPLARVAELAGHRSPPCSPAPARGAPRPGCRRLGLCSPSCKRSPRPRRCATTGRSSALRTRRRCWLPTMPPRSCPRPAARRCSRRQPQVGPPAPARQPHPRPPGAGRCSTRRALPGSGRTRLTRLLEDLPTESRTP